MSGAAVEDEASEASSEHDFIDLKKPHELDSCDQEQLRQYVEKLHSIIRKYDIKLAAYKQKLRHFVSKRNRRHQILFEHYLQLQLSQENKNFRDQASDTAESDYPDHSSTEKSKEDNDDLKGKNEECKSSALIFKFSNLLVSSDYFVLLATAATSAAPRPDPSSDSIMSHALSDFTSFTRTSLM